MSATSRLESNPTVSISLPGPARPENSPSQPFIAESLTDLQHMASRSVELAHQAANWASHEENWTRTGHQLSNGQFWAHVGRQIATKDTLHTVLTNTWQGLVAGLCAQTAAQLSVMILSPVLGRGVLSQLLRGQVHLLTMSVVSHSLSQGHLANLHEAREAYLTFGSGHITNLIASPFISFLPALLQYPAHRFVSAAGQVLSELLQAREGDAHAHVTLDDFVVRLAIEVGTHAGTHVANVGMMGVRTLVVHHEEIGMAFRAAQIRAEEKLRRTGRSSANLAWASATASVGMLAFGVGAAAAVAAPRAVSKTDLKFLPRLTGIYEPSGSGANFLAKMMQTVQFSEAEAAPRPSVELIEKTNRVTGLPKYEIKNYAHTVERWEAARQMSPDRLQAAEAMRNFHLDQLRYRVRTQVEREAASTRELRAAWEGVSRKLSLVKALEKLQQKVGDRLEEATLVYLREMVAKMEKQNPARIFEAINRQLAFKIEVKQDISLRESLDNAAVNPVSVTITPQTAQARGLEVRINCDQQMYEGVEGCKRYATERFAQGNISRSAHDDLLLMAEHLEKNNGRLLASADESPVLVTGWAAEMMDWRHFAQTGLTVMPVDFNEKALQQGRAYVTEHGGRLILREDGKGWNLLTDVTQIASAAKGYREKNPEAKGFHYLPLAYLQGEEINMGAAHTALGEALGERVLSFAALRSPSVTEQITLEEHRRAQGNFNQSGKAKGYKVPSTFVLGREGHEQAYAASTYDPQGPGYADQQGMKTPEIEHHAARGRISVSITGFMTGTDSLMVRITDLMKRITMRGGLAGAKNVGIHVAPVDESRMVNFLLWYCNTIVKPRLAREQGEEMTAGARVVQLRGNIDTNRLGSPMRSIDTRVFLSHLLSREGLMGELAVWRKTGMPYSYVKSPAEIQAPGTYVLSRRPSEFSHALADLRGPLADMLVGAVGRSSHTFRSESSRFGGGFAGVLMGISNFANVYTPHVVASATHSLVNGILQAVAPQTAKTLPRLVGSLATSTFFQHFDAKAGDRLIARVESGRRLREVAILKSDGKKIVRRLTADENNIEEMTLDGEREEQPRRLRFANGVMVER